MKTRRLPFSFALALGLTLTVLAGLGGSLTRVRATTYTVINTDASGPGSLRRAILDANGNAGHDTINFGVSGAIVLTDALPVINDDLTITGPGAENLAVSGDNTYRPFTINSGQAVTITGLTVRDGSADYYGGGIWSAGDLHLGAAHILNNSADWGYGGGVYVQDGSATLTGMQVVSNSAAFGGGVYVRSGSVTLSGTQVVSNSVFGPAGAGLGGGVCVDHGSATLIGTQVVSNSASDYGGGVLVYGDVATLNVSGGTIDSNSAALGGGMFVWSGSATLSGTQVSNNSASDGGGVCVAEGSATLSGTQVSNNSASSGSEVSIYHQGSATLAGTQITANDAPAGIALYTGGTITATTALTITGDVYQGGGRFEVSSHDLHITGSLRLYKGDFYAPDAPSQFTLTGPFTHTSGSYHQTRDVSGSDDVGFPKAGGLIINANGQALDSTTVTITAGTDCAGVPVGQAVRHCYDISPDNASGRNATLTLFYRASEMPAGHACAAMEAYRWTGAWDTRLARDGDYGSEGRLCGPDPQSLRATGVSTFSLFVLRGPAVDARISKGVTPAIAVPGQSITYTLTFSNAGLVGATGVAITDSIPANVDNTRVVSTGVGITQTGSAPDYVWRVADLAPGTGGVITITGALNSPLAAGPFTNTARIAIVAGETITTNNSSAVSVTVSNAAPVLDQIGNQSVDEEVELAFGATATDANGDTLSYSLAGAPPGAIINSSSGAFSWTPTEAQGPGDYSVTVVAGDGAFTGSETISITVNEVNLAPTISDIPNQSTGEGVAVGPLCFMVDDADIPTNTLTLDKASSNTTLVTTTNIVFGIDGTLFIPTLTITPTAGVTGTTRITITVSDGDLSAYDTFILAVGVNCPPEFTSVPVEAAVVGVPYSYAISAIDADAGDVLTFTAPLSDTWLTLTQLTSRTATLDGTPPVAGVVPVVLQVGDGQDGDTQSFSITSAYRVYLPSVFRDW